MSANDLEARLVAVESKLAHHGDLEAIRDLMYEYGFAFDEDRFDDFANCFTENATGQYHPFAPGFSGRQEIVDFCHRLRDEDSLPRLEMVVHYTVSPIIEIDGDSASGRWNWIAPCTVTKANRDRVAAWQFGRYDVQYARTSDGWKIQHQTTAYFEVFEHLEGWVRQPMMSLLS
ncbi:nuclear transport factor 2 family protein [Kribbella sp. NPDC056345]|uniref:nuclear transport factor 2 family protein n=1 Tax=Kribbella sp. NPDC056345 TaxID=3345789 RepID=UPI0035D94245